MNFQATMVNGHYYLTAIIRLHVLKQKYDLSKKLAMHFNLNSDSVHKSSKFIKKPTYTIYVQPMSHIRKTTKKTKVT